LKRNLGDLDCVGQSFRWGNSDFRHVGAGRQIDPDFILTAGLMIILGDALPDLPGGGADDRIEVRIVIRLPPEYLNPEGTFLEVVGLVPETKGRTLEEINEAWSV